MRRFGAIMDTSTGECHQAIEVQGAKPFIPVFGRKGGGPGSFFTRSIVVDPALMRGINAAGFL
jgi:hypothetical protein